MPFAWIDEWAPGILAAAAGEHEDAARALAANGRDTVADCFVAGLEPEDPDSFFRADIRIEDGVPVVTPIPDLNEGGTRNVRVYRVLGATTLGPGAEWDDVTDRADLAETGYRFFKAAVSLPPQP